MKTTAFWKLILLCGALAVFGCKSGSTDSAPETEGSAAAATETETPEGEAPAEGEAAAEAPAEAPAEAAAEEPAAAVPMGDMNIVGTWNLDVQKTLDAQEMTDEERQMATAFMAAMQMSLTFEDGGAMAMNATIFGETKSETGTYTVNSSEGANWQISSTTTGTEEGAEPETTTMNIVFTDGNTFSAAEEGSEETMFFTRAQ